MKASRPRINADLQLVSINDVAAELDLNYREVYKLVQDGFIPHVRIGRCIRIFLADVPGHRPEDQVAADAAPLDPTTITRKERVPKGIAQGKKWQQVKQKYGINYDEVPDVQNVIYLVRGNGLYKIGFCRNLRPRIRDLQAASPVKLAVVAYRPVLPENFYTWERELHDQFKAYRRHGEWFSLPAAEVIRLSAEFVDARRVSEDDITQIRKQLTTLI